LSGYRAYIPDAKTGLALNALLTLLALGAYSTVTTSGASGAGFAGAAIGTSGTIHAGCPVLTVTAVCTTRNLE
jgi:hypothetical protein